MARPTGNRLLNPADLQMNALIGTDGKAAVIFAVVEFVRQADSETSRRALMNAVGFPLDDVRAFLVVSHLAIYGPLRPSELADRIETGAANVTKIVSRLEDAGLAARSADPDDGRSVIVALTEQGARIGRDLIAKHRSAIEEWSARWSRDDIDLFLRMAEDFSRTAALMS